MSYNTNPVAPYLPCDCSQSQASTSAIAIPITIPPWVASTNAGGSVVVSNDTFTANIANGAPSTAAGNLDRPWTEGPSVALTCRVVMFGPVGPNLIARLFAFYGGWVVYAQLSSDGSVKIDGFGGVSGSVVPLNSGSFWLKLCIGMGFAYLYCAASDETDASKVKWRYIGRIDPPFTQNSEGPSSIYMQGTIEGIAAPSDLSVVFSQLTRTNLIP